MRLKARNKIQKYVPDANESQNPNYSEYYEEEINNEYENEFISFSQREENMLIFEIIVENLFNDLNKISNMNNILKASMSNFKRRKEAMFDFIKRGQLNDEVKACVRIFFYVKKRIRTPLSNIHMQ